MAGLWAAQPSFELGVKVVRVTGLDQLELTDQRRHLEAGGTLFVRYYVPAGDGTRRLRVETREVPCGGEEAFWGELARFERWGLGAAAAAGAQSTPAAPAQARSGGLMFELRWRPPPPSSSRLLALLGMNSKGSCPPSRVLARAELSWQDAAASKPAEKWLTLSPAAGSRELSGCKAPKLLVEVDVVVHAAVAGDHLQVTERKAGGVDTCCSAGEYCGQCGWVGSEEDMFLAATFSQ